MTQAKPEAKTERTKQRVEASEMQFTNNYGYKSAETENPRTGFGGQTNKNQSTTKE